MLLGIRRYGLKSNYTPVKLEEALSKIRSGAMSRLASSKFYKIPAVAFFYKLKSKHTNPVLYNKNMLFNFTRTLKYSNNKRFYILKKLNSKLLKTQDNFEFEF